MTNDYDDMGKVEALTEAIKILESEPLLNCDGYNEDLERLWTELKEIRSEISEDGA